MVNTQQQFDFIDSIKALAQASQKSLGVPASVTIAQAILETAWGKSDPCRDQNNFFGIRDSFTTVHYRTFRNAASCFAWREAMLRSKRYAPALAAKNDPYEFAKQLRLCGWSEDPAYDVKLGALIADHGLDAYDVAEAA